MSPGDELRAVAELVRTTAGKIGDLDVLIYSDSKEWGKYYGGDEVELPDGDAPWIALMNPRIAASLEQLLEGAADAYDAIEAEQGPKVAALSVRHALELAHAINPPKTADEETER